MLAEQVKEKVHNVLVRLSKCKSSPRVAFYDTAYEDNIRKFRATLGAKVQVGDSTLKHAGRGLYARERIEKDQGIIEYYGQIISFEEAKKRRVEGKASHIRSLIPMSWCVDGRHVDEGAAMINDPRAEKHKVNAELVSYHALDNIFKRDPKYSVAYARALRVIEPGEEIFVSYGSDYDWSEVDQATYTM